MDKYEYAIKEELKWIEEDIRITKDCINGKEPTQFNRTQLYQRLMDTENEKARIEDYFYDYENNHGKD